MLSNLILGFISALRKHTYYNILNIFQPKNGKFSDKTKSDIFNIPAQNIDCEYALERGGSNKYLQSIFL